MIERKPYYWVSAEDDTGNQKNFFGDARDFLDYLKDNDQTTCGCAMLSEKQWKAVEAAGPDGYVNFEEILD